MNCQGERTVYLLSEFLLVFMFARVYFAVKSVLNYTKFMNHYARKVCNAYGFENSIFFTIKSLLADDNSERPIAYLFIVTVVLFAYVIRIFEMPRFRIEKDDTFDSYFNSIWFTVITITTIGYGDISPKTQPGMIVTIVLAFWGAVLMAILVVALM